MLAIVNRRILIVAPSARDITSNSRSNSPIGGSFSRTLITADGDCNPSISGRLAKSPSAVINDTWRDSTVNADCNEQAESG